MGAIQAHLEKGLTSLMTNLLLCHHNEGKPEWVLLHLSQAGRDNHLANHPLDFIPQGPSCPVDETTTTVAETTTTVQPPESTTPGSSPQPSAPTTAVVVPPLGETVTSVAGTSAQAPAHLPATGLQADVMTGGAIGLVLLGSILLSLRSSRKINRAAMVSSEDWSNDGPWGY